MNVEKRALNGTLVGIVSFIITSGQTILLVPILIRFWGVENYGLWLSLSALCSLLQTIDTGHQNYVGNELSKLYSFNAAKLKIVLASSIWMAIILGFSQLLISIVIVTLGFTRTLIGSTSHLKENQEIGLGLIVLTFTWMITGTLGGILGRLYLPAGLFVRFTIWGIITRFFNVASILFTAILGGKILVACMVSSIVLLTIYILLFWDVYRIFYKLYPFWTGGNWQTAFTNVSKSVFLTGVGFLLQLQNNGLALVVSSIVGSAFLPTLNTMRTLGNTFLAGTTIVTQPLIPEMIRYHIQGEHEKLVSMIYASWWVGGMLINIGLVVTLPLIKPVYLYWTGGQISFDLSLYLLLAWSISLKNFGNPLSVYLMGINNLQAQSTVAIVQTTVVLGITTFFLAKYGLIAVGVAIVSGEIFGSLIIPTIFAIKELQYLGGNLLLTQVMLAFSAVVTVGLTYLFIWMVWLSPLTASIGGVVTLIGIYLWQWQHLPIEVRSRLTKLVHKFKFSS